MMAKAKGAVISAAMPMKAKARRSTRLSTVMRANLGPGLGWVSNREPARMNPPMRRRTTSRGAIAAKLR
jgi:hypothetical protein